MPSGMVFRAFVLLCRQLDLFGRELIAVDGTRIKAVNNKDRNFTRASLTRFIAQADARLADYLGRLDQSDAEEGRIGGAPAAQPPGENAGPRERPERAPAVLAELEGTRAGTR